MFTLRLAALTLSLAVAGLVAAQPPDVTNAGDHEPDGGIPTSPGAKPSTQKDKPPVDANCDELIAAELPSNSHAMPSTYGYLDIGDIANSLSGLSYWTTKQHLETQADIALIRCEQQNIKAKLDYLIRVLHPSAE